MATDFSDNPAAQVLIEGSLDWGRDRLGNDVAAVLRSGKTGAEETLGQLEELANNGSHIAALYLGFAYRDGVGVHADSDKAEAWFRRAADSGDGYALHILARVLASMKRQPEALPIYRAALSAGHLASSNFLGPMLLYGRGVPRDSRGGMDVLLDAARRGHGPASALYGRWLIRTHWHNPYKLIRGAWFYWRGYAAVSRALAGASPEPDDDSEGKWLLFLLPLLGVCLWLGSKAGIHIMGSLCIFGFIWWVLWLWSASADAARRAAEQQSPKSE